MVRTGWAFLLGLTILIVGAGDASAGQFKRAVYYHAGPRPYQVVATHLTDSGNLDLVVANLTNQIFVLLGNGDGTFQQPIKLSIPSPVALAVGDFNGDGKEDLVVAEYGGTGESAVAILLGDGTGRFRLSATYPSGVETTGVAVADFNGDGHYDVVVADNIGSVKVFFGTGKGTLGKPATYRLPGTNPISIAAGDLNGDGHPDLAVAEAIGGSVAVLLNDGTGKFLKPITY
jgi:Tfp pilus tip-associated adhesin PilY1